MTAFIKGAFFKGFHSLIPMVSNIWKSYFRYTYNSYSISRRGAPVYSNT